VRKEPICRTRALRSLLRYRICCNREVVMVTKKSANSGPALLFDRYCCEILSRGKQWQAAWVIWVSQSAALEPRGIDWRLDSLPPHLDQRIADTRVQMLRQDLELQMTNRTSRLASSVVCRIRDQSSWFCIAKYWGSYVDQNVQDFIKSYGNKQFGRKRLLMIQY
jgi:hypothetical protein